jgi:hypothetical protein
MVAWAALIPAAISAVSAMSQKGGGQQQQAQASAPGAGGGMMQPLPQMQFPQNFPDGGRRSTPSMLDFYGPGGIGMEMQQEREGQEGPGQRGQSFGMQSMQPQQQPQQSNNNFMVPGGGKPLSVIDAFLPGGTSPSIFNPIQDPIQGALGGLLKGIFK